MDVKVILDKFRAMRAVEIAEFLEGEGIRGSQKSAMHCPIATYITKETFEDTCVCNATVNQYPFNEDVETQTYVIYQSSIDEFISRFDSGEFPNLIAE